MVALTTESETGLHAGELAGRELLRGRLGALPDGGQELLRRAGLSLHDDRERADRLLPEVVLEDRAPRGRCRSRGA